MSAAISFSDSESPLSLRKAEVLLEALRSRRSFPLDALDPTPIEPAMVERMLEAANWAPSHRRSEPWRFVVFAGEQRGIVGEALAEAYRRMAPDPGFSAQRHEALRAKVWKAPVWIALGMHVDPNMVEWEETVAFGCAVHNAWTMACAQGLACKWTSGATATHAHVAEMVGFEADVRLHGFLYVGRPAGEWPEGSRRPVEQKVRWAGR